MPDVKLDFSRVTYSNVLEMIAPIIPGGILAVGTVVLNPTLASKILSNPYLGYRSRLVAAIFIAYAAGLLLNLLVGYTSYFVGYVFGHLWGSTLFPNPPKPWTDSLWRKAARIFLGRGLAPTTDEPYFKEFHEQKIKEANALQDSKQREDQLKFVEEFFRPKQMVDSDWYWWNQILDKYFATPWAAPSQYFLSIVNTSSWTIVLLMLLNHRNHWLAWLLCIIGLFFGNFSPWATGYAKDPYAFDQTAMILRSLKPLVKGATQDEKE